MSNEKKIEVTHEIGLGVLLGLLCLQWCSPQACDRSKEPWTLEGEVKSLESKVKIIELKQKLKQLESQTNVEAGEKK
jgi:hypothetical protein